MNVYEVYTVDGFTVLVEAKSKPQARAFASKRLKIERVTAMRAHALAARGVPLEQVPAKFTEEEDEE